MSEWKEYQLKELTSKIGSGSTPKGGGNSYKDEGISLIRSQNILDYKFSINGLAYIDEVQANVLKNVSVEEHDILLNITGDSVARCCNAPKEFLPARVNQHVAIIRSNIKLLDNNFLKYSLIDSKEELLSLSEIGGTRNALTKGMLENFVIKLPSLPEQKAIASVLSALDNKIDLLHRQNKTLEAMAETLFRQWFVEEAQNDWVHGALKDEFAFTMGQSPKGSSFNEEQIGTPMFQGNADFGFRFPKERVYTTEPTRFAQKLDTLISVRAPVGAQNMARSKCCIGRGVAAFRHINNPDWYTYTYFKLRYLMDEIKKFNDEGTVFGSISKSDFEKIEVIIPPVSIIHNYEIMVKPLNDRVITNCFQIEKLENLRGTLLPKLMSGEVRVNYTPEEIKQ